MRLVAAAAALAAFAAAAQDGPRWGPVAESLGTGSGICLEGADIVCAVVLCEDGGLKLGVLGKGGGEGPDLHGRIDIDGQVVERDMEGRLVMDGLLYLRTPVQPGGPLWQRLRAGSRLSFSSPEGDPLEYSLRGSAAELDRVEKACR